MNSLSSKPFAKKFFYVDLKGFPKEKKLVKDLELLGAKQEVFLSKTVSFVVSNRISLTESGSPSTSVSNNKSKSPYLFKDSSLDNRDSPVSYSPGFEQKLHNESFVPLSRGMSVLQKAREKQQGNNKFILDICKQWNIKVYPVQKVLSWIEKYKSKYFKHSTAKPKQELASENVTRLYSPFVKIEDSQRRYKPRYKVFPSWSENVDSTLLKNANKLVANYRQFGNVDISIRPPLKEIFVQPQSSSKPLKRTVTEAVDYSVSKATGYNSTKTGGHNSSKVAGNNSISNSVLGGGLVGKQTEKGPRKTKKEKHAKKKKSYCEICGVYYSDGEAHYEKNSHTRFLNNSANYKMVEKEMEDLQTVDDFLNSLLAKNIACEGVTGVSEDTLEEENCSDENGDQCLESNENDKEDLCTTEVYALNENDFVSASCSSIDSPLPFLEKNGNVFPTKGVSLSPSFHVDSDTLRSQGVLNPPLLFPQSCGVTLESTDKNLHVAVSQNLGEISSSCTWNCNGFENYPNMSIDDSLTGLVSLSKNFTSDTSDLKKNENGQQKPASLAQNSIGSLENETNAPTLLQAQDLLHQPLTNLYDENIEQPLDLSNCRSNEKIILNEKQISVNSNAMDNMNELKTLNANLSYAVTDPSLISPHLNSKNSINALDCDTVNVNSEAESFDSEPNLAGFGTIINNCLEEVTKSLVKDSSTTEEDGLSNELPCQNSNVLEFVPVEFTTTMNENKEDKPLVHQAESSETGVFQKQLVEDPFINHPSCRTIEYPDKECETICTSVIVTRSDFYLSTVKASTLFSQKSSFVTKQEATNAFSVKSISENEDENMSHCNTTESIEKLSSQWVCASNTGETPERFDVLGLTSSLVSNMQARVSPELLLSGDAYLVIDEADSSFNSVKEEKHANKINCIGRFLSPDAVTNTIDTFGSTHKTVGMEDIETKHIQSTYTSSVTSINETAENNKCDQIRCPSIDPVDKEGNEEFSETRCDLKDSLNTNLACETEMKDGDFCHKRVLSVSDMVSKIQNQETEENGIASNERKYPCEIKGFNNDQNNMDCSNAEMLEKKIEMTGCSEITTSGLNPFHKTVEETDTTQDVRCDVKNIMNNSKVFKSKEDDIYCDIMEYSTTDAVCKTSEMEFSNNKGGCHNNAKEDKAHWNEKNSSGKRKLENKEFACKKRKCLNDSLIGEKSYDSVKHQLNGAMVNTVMEKGSNNNMEHPSVAETITNLGPHLLNRQFSGDSDVISASSANDSLISNSSSFESSFCSSNESNTSLLGGILPSNFPVADSIMNSLQNHVKNVHIIYLSAPPTS